MAAPALPVFTPQAFTSTTATNQNSVIQLPAGSSPTTVLVVNLGSSPASILLGADNTIVASQSNGTVVMPGHPLALAYQGYLACIALGFGNAQLNISVGV